MKSLSKMRQNRQNNDNIVVKLTENSEQSSWNFVQKYDTINAEKRSEKQGLDNTG